MTRVCVLVRTACVLALHLWKGIIRAFLWSNILLSSFAFHSMSHIKQLFKCVSLPIAAVLSGLSKLLVQQIGLA